MPEIPESCRIIASQLLKEKLKPQEKIDKIKQMVIYGLIYKIDWSD